MIFLKISALLFTSTLIGALGLTGITSVYLVNSSEGNQTGTHIQTSSTNNYEDVYSEKFYQLKKEIKNEGIDKNEINDSVEKLESGFEKDFLKSLIGNREGKYEESYKLLVNHLKDFPALPEFYELLASMARITSSLNLLKNELAAQKDSTNINYYFLNGLIEFNRQNYQNAKTEFNKCIELDSTFAEAQYWLGHNLRMKGDYEQAVNILTNIQFNDENELKPLVKNAIGSVYYLSGQYEKAEQYFNEAYDLSTKINNKSLIAKSLANLAIIKDLYGDVEAARENFQTAISIAEKIEDNELLAFLFSELGVSYSYTGNLIESREYYNKSYQLYSSLNNNERLSYLSGNIASIYLQQANYNSALKYYKQGLKFSGENILGQVLNLTGIADVYANNSNYSEALEYYNKAHTLADSIKNISAVSRIDQGIGALYFNVNKPLKGLKFLRDAEMKLDPAELPFEAAEIYHKIGMVLMNIDSLNEAKKYFLNALEITENSGDLYQDILIGTELSNLYIKEGNTLKAKKLLSENLKLSENYQLLQLKGLQKFYLAKINVKENDLNSAIKNLEEAFEISGSVKDLNNQIEAGYMLSKIYVEQKNFQLEENMLLKTVSLVEKISSSLISEDDIYISHFSGVVKIYKALTRLYISQNRFDEAFETMEKYRSRNSLQNLFNMKLAAGSDDELTINKVIDLKWMIGSGLYSNDETDSLNIILRNLVASADKVDKTKLYTELPWMKINEIKEKLDEDENLISFFVDSDFTLVFCLNKYDLKYKKIEVKRDSLLNMLGKISPVYKSELYDREIYINQDLFSFDAKASWEFYDKTFSSTIENISPNQKIIFCFPEELLQLPAEMLVTEWKNGASPYVYKDKKFLIERNPVAYSPSASIYITQKERENSVEGQNLFVGDPQINNNEFRINYRSGLLGKDDLNSRSVQLYPLEYSAQELENLGRLIADSKVLLSTDATEKQFKVNAPGSKILHLSTHSFLFNNQPVIILTQSADSVNDGFLEAGEIVQLNLKSDMVVLSSCRSGLGEIDEAEGILGMQKAFFEAGASSIVVSLWDVNDKYTSVFMQDFYKNLSDGNDKAEALRSAKINFIKKYSANPYYWSAFVLAGNTSPINIHKSSSNNIFFYLFAAALIMFVGYFFRIKLKA